MSRLGLLALVCFTVASAPVPSRTDRLVRKIGSIQLLYASLSASLDPASPVVPKNTPAGVRVRVLAGADELSEEQVARFAGGPFAVEGELAGPGLGGARTLRSEPSKLLLPIPALPVSGDYVLSNVRLVAEGRTVLDVSPSPSLVEVIEQVLVTSVKTRPLTLEELQARGVVFDGDDVLGFEFTLGMMLESKPIQIAFPVAFDREGVPVPQPLAPPPDPARTGVAIDLPPLPAVFPLLLEPEGDVELPEIELPGGGSDSIRIPSVLVIPGDVGFLKQFFSAQLFIANGTPAGSGLVVRDVLATIELPPGDALALPELTTGIQEATLPVRGMGPDGEAGTTDDPGSLGPGEQGQAEFLVRAEKEGFHTLAFEIEAVLDGLVTGEVELKGRASGGVLVRNPFFDITFTVPSVVRAEESFELFVTVHNIGEGLANAVDVSFDERALSGLELAPGAPATQRIDTLLAGDSTTLAFDFKALRTGKLVATYLRFDGEPAAEGSIHFTLGVADGVPLSPDTLVLPSSVDALDPSVVRAAMRVLGQAWSIAKAPPGTLAPQVRRIRASAVIEKALLLAEAGLRVQLGESHDSAVRGLLFDFHGGDPIDEGFDALLRTMAAGRDFTSAISLELEDAMEEPGGVLGYERETALVAASGPDFLSFAVGSTSAVARLLDGSGREGSDVPGAVVLENGAGVLGLVSSPISSPYALLFSPTEPSSTGISVTLPGGDGTFVRGEAVVELEPEEEARLLVDLFRPESLEVEIDRDGDGLFETRIPLAIESLASRGPELLAATLIGPETLDGASAYGFHAAALFDRVVGKNAASDPSRFRLRNNLVKGASRQLSGRLVFLTLERPEGPYEAASLEAIEIEDLRGAKATRTVSVGSLLADAGAVVTGRVFQAGGTPVAAGSIAYANYRSGPDCSSGEELVFAEVPLEPDGSYQLRYVRRDPCGAPFRIFHRSLDSGELRDVRGYVRAPGERIRLDLALFGRGAVSGTVLENGVPAPGAEVVVTSGTDPQSGGIATTDGDGRFTVYDVVVGPVSVKAARGIAAGASSGRIARAGSTAVVDVVLDPGKVRVRGTVSKLEKGVSSPLPGVQVVYALRTPGSFGLLPVGVTRSAAGGSYVLEDLPFGEFELSAILDLETKASIRAISTPGEDRTENLVVAIPAPSELGTVRGRVVLPDGVTGAAGAIVGVGTREVASGEDGAFEIPGVPVMPGIAQPVLARSPDGKRHGSASVVVSQQGQVVPGVVIPLSGLGTLAFTVLDPDQKPVIGQLVGLLGNCANLCGCAFATTNGLGVAELHEVPIGTHFARAVFVGSDFVDVALGSARIEKEGDRGEGRLLFPGTGTVTGTVLLPGGLEPAVGADVILHSPSFDRDSCELRSGVSHRGRTDALGKFTFRSVNFGRVSATASHPFADAAVGGTASLTPSTPVDFELLLVDTTAGIVSGRVFLPDGVTPAGGGVEITAVGPLPEVSVRTGDDGGYEFRSIFPQGKYTFTVLDPVTGLLARDQIFLRAGMDSEHDFRLKGRGRVRVRVVDAEGDPVESAYVKLTESEFPGNVFESVLSPSSEGVATFASVFEGPFSVEAKDVFGRDGGRVPSVLPGPDAEIDVEVRLNAVGVVEGRFLLPGGATPIPFGVVKMLAGGRPIGQATTAGDGSFRFDYVPIGAIRLEAQDPLTARQGFATGELLAEGEVLTLDVLAQGLGRVEGTVRANGLGQAAAQVELVSGSFRAATTADDDGFYFMEGVPEGQVVATASLANGFLSGTDAGTLLGDGGTLLLDLALRDSAAVSGSVVRALSGEPAPPSIVTISVGGPGGGSQSTTTSPDGTFRFERVPAGLATIEVSVLGSIDRGKRIFDLPPGGNLDLTLSLNGVGAIEILARDSHGQPIAGKVTLSGIGDFPYSLVVTLGAEGSLLLPEVLAGPVSAKLEVAGPPKLFGTRTGLVFPDDRLELVVTVEPSGQVSGLVRRPDSAPAPGAMVLLVLSDNRGIASTQTNAAGEFHFEGIPLGRFDLRVEDPFTAGVGQSLGLELTSEDAQVEGIAIDLDDSPVRVLTVDPHDGALNVPSNQVVRVTFSDPVAALNGAFTVKHGAATVPLAAQLEPGGLAATLTGTLPDAAILTVQVTTSLVDLFGRNPLAPFTSTFRTVDLSAPRVVASLPADGAFEVGATPEILVTFDEPLSSATDFASLISLVGQAGAIDGTSERISATGARFMPSLPLGDNAVFEIVVTGAIDDLGNAQGSPVKVARFATRDTMAPVLSLLTPQANGWVAHRRPTIQVAISDNASGVDPATASMKLDGTAASASFAGDRMVLASPHELAEGEHVVEASIADRAMNQGSFSGAFFVDVTPPSQAVLESPASGMTLRGIVRFKALASDLPSGVARIDLRRAGSFFTSLTGPDFEKDYDTSFLAEGDALLTARAVDLAGNVGPESPPVPVTVDNRSITVSFFQPQPNQRVRDSVFVWVSVSEPVTRVEFRAGPVVAVDETVPYDTTLDLASVPEGVAEITATAFGLDDTGTASRNVVIDRTPPTPPDPDLVFAEPPAGGASLVHGLAGAVEAAARIDAVNLDAGSAAATTADDDGRFALSLPAAIGDLVSLTATDDLGNQSVPTVTAVRSIPSLPPPESAARLEFEGVVADRVSLAELEPDGELDAVFSVRISLGEGVSRTLDFIELAGPELRTTRASAGGVLGVASSAAGAFLNDPDGRVSFQITESAALSLIASDGGFVVEGEAYTVTLAFTDGARLVGTATVVPRADERGVPHSLRISASPETAIVPDGFEGRVDLLIEDVRDIEGTPVPDGARIALAASDMATFDPFGNPIRSAGGRIEGGEPAANDPAFQVFTVAGGQVSAVYATGSLVPGSVLGALAVVQALAADAEGNVLGRETIGTLDLNLRAKSDRAQVFVESPSLYADAAPRRTAIRVEAKDAFGAPLPDGTVLILSATSCIGRHGGACIESSGGTILGSTLSPPTDSRQRFEVQGGEIRAEYQIPATGSAPPGTVRFATIQVVPTTTQDALGTATISLTGAGGAEIDLSPGSLPLVFPERQAQIRVRHVHDMRGNLVPEGATLLLSASFCATRIPPSNSCTESDGGMIVDGSPVGFSGLRAFTLGSGAINATYEPRGLDAFAGTVKNATIQLAMADFAGKLVTPTRIALRSLPLLAPAHSAGVSHPPSLFADGKLRTATVSFSPVLDGFGNALPEGTRVAASSAHNFFRRDGFLIPSVLGSSILNGEVPPSGSHRLLTVEDGSISVQLGVQGLGSPVGAIPTANVMLVPAAADGATVGSEVIGVVPVPLPGFSSARAVASPALLEADGADRRSIITISNLKDALGNPVPDGTRIALSATRCTLRVGGNCVPADVSATILGGEPFSSSVFFRGFPVTDGQVVAELSIEGIQVSSGSRTAVVQVAAADSDGDVIGQEVAATAEIELVAPGGNRVEAAPVGLFASGAPALSSITVSLDSFPDGTQVALTAADCAARNAAGGCIASAGGGIHGAGHSPGDGEPANGDDRFRLFTVMGGQVKAVYSSEAIVSGISESKVARISVVPADGSGGVVSSEAIATGEVHLHGASAATPNGPTRAPIGGEPVKITFAGIRDALGNQVPDGTLLLATAGNCATRTPNGSCNASVGGTLLDGAESGLPGFRTYTVTDGSVTVTYSAAGAASAGNARIQLAPAASDGAPLGDRGLHQGVHVLIVN